MMVSVRNSCLKSSAMDVNWCSAQNCSRGDKLEERRDSERVAKNVLVNPYRLFRKRSRLMRNFISGVDAKGVGMVPA